MRPARARARRRDPSTADGRPVTEHVTDRRLTTPAVLHQEQDSRRGRPPTSDPSNWSSAIRRRHGGTAIAGHDRLVLVVGPAGTGKTHTTAQAVADLQAEDRPGGRARPVRARPPTCSPARPAVRPTPWPGSSPATSGHRPSPWPAGTTVVLDEAGMAATDDLARLVELVRSNQWRLVAVGDPAQLPSVARGGVFAHWCDTIPRHALDEPRRFTEAVGSRRQPRAPRRSSPTLSRPTPPTAASTAPTPRLVADRIARAQQRHIDAGRSVAITTTNTDTPARSTRRSNGNASPAGHGVATARRHHVPSSATRSPPDATTRGCGPAEGERVRNRHTWTVTAVHPDGQPHRRPSAAGLASTSRADYVADHVELGWAVTGYGTQGDTVDIGIAVLDASTNRNHTYVAMTRGRHANHAVLSDAPASTTLPNASPRSSPDPTSTESALAVQQRLHRVAGVEPPAAR